MAQSEVQTQLTEEKKPDIQTICKQIKFLVLLDEKTALDRN